tara:strand:- start:218 stop:475 length:258 start_codon:yes stop_codon:yes gene_type:complete
LAEIINPSPNYPIVNEKGQSNKEFTLWLQQITGLQILGGSGSPENVVSAAQKSLYMDTAGTAGSILYIKRDASVAGDKKKGWILV